MAGFEGVVVSDPWLHNQFTQVELRSLKNQFLSVRNDGTGVGSRGSLTLRDLSSAMSNLKIGGAGITEDERAVFLRESYPDLDRHVDFELFLRVYLEMQGKVGAKNSSSAFLKAATTTLLHTISESEKASYVSHINNYLGDDPFLKKYLPIDPMTNDLFEIAKDGVLLCKLINVAVPGTIDERVINTKRVLNLWEKNENLMLFLNSAKAIGCTVVNIGTQDLAEGRPHLVLGLISQIIKIQLLADVNLKKTPQLVELVDDGKDVEELMSLPPEKILLRWMNFQLKKGGFRRSITNFSSDVKDSEAYACLLNVLAPEHSRKPYPSTVKDLLHRANLVLEHADRIGCKRYLTPKDIIDGSPNLNLAFVAHIFQKRNGLSSQMKQITFLEANADDPQVSREERVFRLWINSLGISYINNVFEDLRTGWVLLEALDKVAPGIVCWKSANKPPIKMPFKKVENSFLWQLMRYNILQLLRNLRFHTSEKEIKDVDILNWANNKIKSSGRYSRMDNFKDRSLSSGIFFLDLLSAVDPRVVNWNLVTKGGNDEEKKMNASYIISAARKLGCSVFLLPEDILEVNQKMMLTLTASIMHWYLKRPTIKDTSVSLDGENGISSDSTSSSSSDDSASESSTDDTSCG